MDKTTWVAVLCAGSLGATGCMRQSVEDAPWIAEVEAEAARLDAALDTVEGRLLAGRSRVALWEELAERHRTVSQIACANAESHMEGISRHFAKTQEVLRKKKTRRRDAARSARQARNTPPAGSSDEGVGGPADDE